MHTETYRQELSERWISFAGVGAERLAKKLGISLEEYVMSSMEDMAAFENLLREERENYRANMQRSFCGM